MVLLVVDTQKLIKEDAIMIVGLQSDYCINATIMCGSFDEALTMVSG